MTVTQNAIHRLTEDPTALSSHGVRAVAVRVESRADFERSYLYVLVTLKAPDDGGAWSVEGMRAVRREVRERAGRLGIDEDDLMIGFITEMDAGDPDNSPDDGPPSEDSE